MTCTIPTAAVLLDLDAPELALLGALEHMLEASCNAVEAANPILLTGSPQYYADPTTFARLWAAEELRHLARQLARAVDRYKAAVHTREDTSPSDPFPF